MYMHAYMYMHTHTYSFVMYRQKVKYISILTVCGYFLVKLPNLAYIVLNITWHSGIVNIFPPDLL